MRCAGNCLGPRRGSVLAGLLAALLLLPVVSSAAPLLINEFVANHVGTDTREFVELFGDPFTTYLGYAVIQLEGDGTVAGVVDSAQTGFVTDVNGFATTPFMSDVLENGAMTLLLVSGYTGVSTGTDLDSNNDGILNAVVPWGAIVDSIAVNDGSGTNVFYSSVVLPFIDLGAFNVAVGGASRIPNGIDTNTVGDWLVNDFDGFGLPGFVGTPTVAEAVNTPGTFNTVVPEPTTLTLLGSGLALAAHLRRKRRPIRPR